MGMHAGTVHHWLAEAISASHEPFENRLGVWVLHSGVLIGSRAAAISTSDAARHDLLIIDVARGSRVLKLCSVRKLTPKLGNNAKSVREFAQ
jgi:hypothetical protein